MPTTLPKNLNLCFTKIKFPLTFQSSSSPLTRDDSSRTVSSASAAAALFKNYNSLYDDTTFEFDCPTSKSLTHSSTTDSEPEPGSDSEPDFATVFASQRFFFTSPGSSNSIVESTLSSVATTTESSCSSTSSGTDAGNANRSPDDGSCDQRVREESSPKAVKDGVAVPTFSPNPYMDFRRSMQEMVDSRGLIDVNANWDYLHELLLCYLALNPKTTHQFIIGAFADLIVSLMAVKQNGDKNVEDDDGVTEITGGWTP